VGAVAFHTGGAMFTEEAAQNPFQKASEAVIAAAGALAMERMRLCAASWGDCVHVSVWGRMPAHL
jgi:hypothetical protein